MYGYKNILLFGRDGAEVGREGSGGVGQHNPECGGLTSSPHTAPMDVLLRGRAVLRSAVISSLFSQSKRDETRRQMRRDLVCYVKVSSEKERYNEI
ncbi:hypothetical protein DdX_08566 [Ditylenchus destructor]|uniref:Uncharacterized protein n=1 Tax=Ditylenchus destructor TaxID=166010 RepID=A0AAD4R7C2_9BILA|nr:hypothetical protein DdX_08566 [Ditylenchus destructor]